MRKKHFFLFVVCTFFMKVACLAQEPMVEKAEMAVGMRADGKIYVVVAVVVTILAGIVLYLINLDRKISRIEKNLSK